MVGLTTEYGSIEFTLIYITEYFMIIINTYILTLLFINDTRFYLFILLSFMYSRGILARYRYLDLLNINWKSFIPLSFSFMIFYKIIS